jgi:hypothetical protein
MVCFEFAVEILVAFLEDSTGALHRICRGIAMQVNECVLVNAVLSDCRAQICTFAYMDETSRGSAGSANPGRF